RGERLFTAAQAGECLAYWPDGSRIVTGNVIAQPAQPKFDSIVRLWNSTTAQASGELKLTDVQVTDLALSDDGSRLAAAGQDGSLRIWQMDPSGRVPEGSGVQERAVEFRANDRPIWAIASSPDGQSFATISHDDIVRVWNARGEQQFELKPVGGPRRLA